MPELYIGKKVKIGGMHSLLEFSLQLCPDTDIIMWRLIWKIDLKWRQVQGHVHSDIHHILHIHVHV